MPDLSCKQLDIHVHQLVKLHYVSFTSGICCISKEGLQLVPLHYVSFNCGICSISMEGLQVVPLHYVSFTSGICHILLRRFFIKLPNPDVL